MSRFAQPSRSSHDETPPEDDAPTPGPATPGASHDLASVLDVIDEVLAVDAQEFVQGFVQKGGQ